MKDYTNIEPKFSESIRITETSDPAHADNINAAPIQLLQNTLSNRMLITKLLRYSYDSSTGRITNMLPFDYDNGKLTVPDGMGHFDDSRLVLTDIS